MNLSVSKKKVLEKGDDESTNPYRREMNHPAKNGAPLRGLLFEGLQPD